MMKKGSASSNAVAGTVSPTTAQGVLPQYAGHATASLTPAVTNKSLSSQGGVLLKPDHKIKGRHDSNAHNGIDTLGCGENCPPRDTRVGQAF